MQPCQSFSPRTPNEESRIIELNTPRQDLGDFGEQLVIDLVPCPCENGQKKFTRLPRNTPSVDLECPGCKSKVQVKTLSLKDISHLPKKILGASWAPQERLVSNGTHPSIYLVLVDKLQNAAVYFISSVSQTVECFEVRKPLSEAAKSPGWTGFYLVIERLSSEPTRVL
jgi:hypothetical protein